MIYQLIQNQKDLISNAYISKYKPEIDLYKQYRRAVGRN